MKTLILISAMLIIILGLSLIIMIILEFLKKKKIHKNKKTNFPIKFISVSVTIAMFLIAIYSLDMNNKLFSSMYRPYLGIHVFLNSQSSKMIDKTRYLTAINFWVLIQNFGSIPSENTIFTFKIFNGDKLIEKKIVPLDSGLLFPNETYEEHFQFQNLNIESINFQYEIILHYNGMNDEEFFLFKKYKTEDKGLNKFQLIDSNSK